MARPFVRLYLVRHGEVDANREMRYLGHRDDDLNDVGLVQAEHLGDAFSELPIDHVMSSPLTRAVRTAEPVGDRTGTPVRIDGRLTELDFGWWEGLTRDEVLARDRELLESWERDPLRPTPAGDSLERVRSRVMDLADDLVTTCSGASVVLVSHVGPVKALLVAALGLPPSAVSGIFLDPATISVVDWSERPIVRLVNSHAHLGWPNPRWLDHRM